jgi:hypothetical protein
MMTRAQCYKLLELDPGASEAQIRRQYKKMALRLHPDINPDPKANEQFIQLTNAVEILLNPEPQRNHASQRKSGAPETEAQRMEQARKRYEQQKAKKIYENSHYFRQLTTGKRWTVFKWIARAGCALSFALMLDAVLPHHYEKDELIAYSDADHNGILFHRITSIQLKNTGIYFAENERGSWMYSYPEVIVKKTWLLHTPVEMYGSDDRSVFTTGFDFHIGSVRWAVALLMLVPLITYFRQRKDLTFVFMYQLSFWGIGGLLVFLLLTENRLGHLLTLGFF